MDLHDYLRILRRHWLLIAAATFAGLLVGGASSIITRPTYTADTQLFVATQSSGSVTELQQGNTFSQARVQSYVKTVTTPVVLQPAIDSLGLDVTAESLAERVTATTDINTVLIKISVSDSSPAQAAAIAQAVSNSLIKTVDTLETPRTGGTSPVSLSVIDPADAPLAPSAPNTKLNLFAGLCIGAALGVGGSVLRTKLDNRIRGESDLRHLTDAPLLGGITFDQDAVKKPLLTQTAPQSPRAESFRQLRTNLQFANVTGEARTVLLTSSLPGEGKSTTATNLAIALAQAGQTVCLVDADLRRPMVHEYLGLDKSVGLTTALVGDMDINELLQPWGDDDLFVLVSGQIPPNPSELLGSQAMRAVIERLESTFDTVVIDAPPLLPVTDAAVLSQHVGGVVVVVGSSKLKHQDLQKSLSALSMVGATLLGVVLNRLPAKGPDAYAYSYYSSEPGSRDMEGLRSDRHASSRQAVPVPETLVPREEYARPANVYPSLKFRNE
ncbi:capsular exopolysaccharide synthesis family protein [Pseudarthrobacter siccitolerans]|uniref:Capsular exopolysaccharide synthesis family protein n=1 Tax=Pseudarthrobacter siccitolerans TaxID=861266 RepID=A0ABU0PL66_9MICC|nr:polysaccharide biosynthesis tyrosine autokinase [Pseudarthrobacter siccitolerans]MDQ0674001.1 capsular exopolysaccharide synthesis family protein [Pseudarthrobacter siccitolerans]